MKIMKKNLNESWTEIDDVSKEEKETLQNLYYDLKDMLLEGSNADLKNNIEKAFEKIGGKAFVRVRSQSTLEVDGQIKDYRIKNYICSGDSFYSDINRLVEDMISGYNQKILGNSIHYTPALIKYILNDTNESLKESFDDKQEYRFQDYTNRWSIIDDMTVNGVHYGLFENCTWGDETCYLVTDISKAQPKIYHTKNGEEITLPTFSKDCIVYETYDDIETCLQDEDVITESLTESFSTIDELTSRILALKDSNGNPIATENDASKMAINICDILRDKIKSVEKNRSGFTILMNDNNPPIEVSNYRDEITFHSTNSNYAFYQTPDKSTNSYWVRNPEAINRFCYDYLKFIELNAKEAEDEKKYSDNPIQEYKGFYKVDTQGSLAWEESIFFNPDTNEFFEMHTMSCDDDMNPHYAGKAKFYFMPLNKEVQQQFINTPKFQRKEVNYKDIIK